MPFQFDQRMKLALAIGFMFCLIISVISGWHEPWDTAIFWLPGYLILIILAAAMGWRYPSAPWQSGRDIGIGEFIAIILIGIVKGDGFGLLPLGLMMMAFLTLPLVIANWMGAYVKIYSVKNQPPPVT